MLYFLGGKTFFCILCDVLIKCPGKHVCWSLFVKNIVKNICKRRHTEKVGSRTLRWDAGPMTLGWDPKVGTLGWYPIVGRYGGTLRWDPKVGPRVRRRSSRLQLFSRIGVPKHFAMFTGKQLCWSLFLTSESLFNKHRCIFLWILWNF